MIFLDSNVTIDLLNAAAGSRVDWATRHFERLIGDEPFATNLIVVAEVAAGLLRPDAVADHLIELEIDVHDLSVEVAVRAGSAFAEYRRRGGPRTTILPDFLIAAHAETLGARLMTRDRRLASYFPDLALLTPETDYD